MPERVKQQVDSAQLQGYRVDDSDPEMLGEAINLAINYRGDVTIQRRGLAAPLIGYLFDQRKGPDGRPAIIRMLENGAEEPVSIPFQDIAELHISGRDTAAGKSWETWVRKYIERKSNELQHAKHDSQ